MKWAGHLIAFAAAWFVSLSYLPSVQAAVKETDWCTVETPARAEWGKPIVVKVTLKEGATAAGAKISNHLHWMKKDGGWGGTLSWKPPENSGDGKTYTFNHSPALKEDMGSVSALVYLATDGDYKNKTKETTGEPIEIFLDPAVIAAAKAEEERVKRPESATLKKSWLKIATPTKPIVVGEEFVITVEYYLDPSDNWADGTKVQLMPLGPWIDNPDGVYTKNRFHIGEPGLRTSVEPIAPGSGKVEYKQKLTGTHRYNEVTWMATFIGGDGKGWPWHVRMGGPTVERFVDKFDLKVVSEGGLFTYNEKPSIDIVWGEELETGFFFDMDFRIINVYGDTIKEFKQKVMIGEQGTKTKVELPEIKERGVMLVLATLDGYTRDAFFGTIPDMAEARKGGHRRKCRHSVWHHDR